MLVLSKPTQERFKIWHSFFSIASNYSSSFEKSARCKLGWSDVIYIYSIEMRIKLMLYIFKSDDETCCDYEYNGCPL